MTYPPQQPPGDPYGQQPQGGGYPGSGGFPQQPQQPGGFPPSGGFGGQQQGGGFGQQPGAYPTGQFGGSFGGPTPPKKSPLPWILTGVGVVVVLLIVLGGGFLWPGWFKSADTSDPKSVAQSYVDAFNNKDYDGANKLACQSGNSSGGVSQSDIDQMKQHNVSFNGSLNGDPSINGNSATQKATVNATLDGQKLPTDWTIQMKKNSDKWCVSGLAPTSEMNGGSGGSGSTGSEQPTDGGGSGGYGGGYGGDTGSAPTDGGGEGNGGGSGPSVGGSGGTGGGGGSGDVQQTLQKLISSINSGDSSGAESLLCPDADATAKQEIDKAIQGHAQAQLEGTPQTSGNSAAGAALQLTVNGQQQLDSVSLINTTGSWCVYDVFGG